MAKSETYTRIGYVARLKGTDQYIKLATLPNTKTGGTYHRVEFVQLRHASMIPRKDRAVVNMLVQGGWDEGETTPEVEYIKARGKRSVEILQ